MSDVRSWLPVDDGTNVWDLIPGPAQHLRTLYAALWDAGVDPITLELCRLRIATLVGSAVDLAARTPQAGIQEALVEALPSWPTGAMFTEQQRAALGFAEQYVLDAHGVTDEQTAELGRLFSPPQLATLTTAIAVFDALTRMRAIITSPAGSPAAIDVELT